MDPAVYWKMTTFASSLYFATVDVLLLWQS